MRKLYSISEAARKLGRSADWLRKAEDMGKLPRARRDYNGWRVYTSADVVELQELLAPSKR
jgi:DNA-binding transcriptional MerR regulator